MAPSDESSGPVPSGGAEEREVAGAVGALEKRCVVALLQGAQPHKKETGNRERLRIPPPRDPRERRQGHERTHERCPGEGQAVRGAFHGEVPRRVQGAGEKD